MEKLISLIYENNNLKLGNHFDRLCLGSGAVSLCSESSLISSLYFFFVMSTFYILLHNQCSHFTFQEVDQRPVAEVLLVKTWGCSLEGCRKILPF